jgi:enhancing lycopene biosynthesis protein 2
MAKSPRKIGVIISGGNPWEIIFCFYHFEKQGLLRVPISIPQPQNTESQALYEMELAGGTPVNLADVKVTGLDAVLVPGGNLLLNTLCNYQEAGGNFAVHDGLKNFLRGVYRLGKPIGAFGASAILVTRALQGITRSGSVVTVGSDPKLQAIISNTGGQAVVTRPGEVILDQTNKLVTSGGEFGTRRPTEINEACENLVTGLSELIEKQDT